MVADQVADQVADVATMRRATVVMVRTIVDPITSAPGIEIAGTNPEFLNSLAGASGLYFPLRTKIGSALVRQF